jgi:UDP-2,3-diacylglucosamine pyrophosphatase LpxH
MKLKRIEQRGIMLIYNDVHCGSPIEMMNLVEFLTEMYGDSIEHGRVYSIGDNFDLAGCKPEYVEILKKARAQTIGNHSVAHIDGNHERCNLKPEYINITGGVLLAHGDFEKWGYKKSVKYRKKKHGASSFKRKFIIPMIEFAEQFGVNRVTKKFKKRVVKLVGELDCHTYICGHIHPKKKLDFVYKGIRIIVLPRGRNKVEL